MKKKFIKFCKISLCAALVVSALSCQTEELSDVTASSSEAEFVSSEKPLLSKVINLNKHACIRRVGN